MALDTLTVAEGTDRQQSLGFVARSVTIENFSNSWVWLGDASKFVAPWRAQTIQLTQPSDIANITWRNPPLIPVAPPTSGQAFTYWSDAPAPTTPAVTLYTGQTQGSTIDSGSFIHTVGPITKTVTVPAGTLALGLAGNGLEAITVSVTGVQTGISYFNNLALTAALNQISTSTFNTDDKQVSVTYQTAGIFTAGYELYAYSFVPLPAQSTPKGMIVDIGGFDGVTTNNPLPVTAISGGTLPALNNNQMKSAIVNQAGLAAGASVALVNGVALETITVYGWSLKVTGNAVNSFTGGQLSDSHGINIHRVHTVTLTQAGELASPDSYFTVYGKQALTVGDPLVLTADAGNTTNLIVHGSIDYFQG